MTNLQAGFMVGVVSSDEVPKGSEKCEWKNCKSNHTQKISYPGGGTVEKSNTYAAKWVAANLEPWQKYGAGQDSLAKKADYRDEVKSADYVNIAATLAHPAYHTQKHHLISAKLFNSVPDLTHNGKLISYDVNHVKNGACYPTFVADIVRHDLQCHRGNHTNDHYYSNIDPLMSDLEVQCLTYCNADFNGDKTSQIKLIKELNKLSEKCEKRIKTWTWLLRSNALDERKKSKSDYAARVASS
jgi:hypothetical protein